MWYLNYCAPFLFNPTSTNMSYRYVMYSEIFALFLLYVIFAFAYRFFSIEEMEIPKFAKQDKATLLTGNRLKCMPETFWVSSKKFKQWYLSYFGLHSVAVGICILYSPYLPQMIFTLIHFVLWIIASIMYHFRNRERKFLTIFYNAVVVVACILNIMLLFSGSMGVGASGYDENAKICLLQSGQFEDL